MERFGDATTALDALPERLGRQLPVRQRDTAIQETEDNDRPGVQLMIVGDVAYSP